MLPLLLTLAGLAGAAGPLDYKPAPFKVELSTQADGGLTVKFPSPVKSLFKPNDTVWGHLYLPPGPGPHACVLVLPVMAAPNIWIETRFVNRFRKDGLCVMWLEMPYQFNRRVDPTQPSGQVFLARNAKRLAGNFRQSVLDARRALYWLSRRPDVNPKKIGVFGISLGAIVGSTVYSVDDTPAFGAFMMGGADFPTLIVNGSMTGPWMRRVGMGADAVRDAWKGIDPLDYKTANARKKALLVNVKSDWVIPQANGLALKEAFPAAEQVWLPLGHYTGILHLVWIPKWISERFREEFSAAGR
jgi:hypothetical protein